MAREVRGAGPSGSTLYARIINPAGLWWNGSAVVAYSSPNYATYAVPMTEQGASGVYFADMPAAILIAGTYEYFVHLQAGASPAEGDGVINTGKIDWTGVAAAIVVGAGMTGSDWRDYVLRKGFKRTDKDTELYEATTDAIQQLRRRFMFDEAEVEKASTDTISVLGDFKLDIESDLGLLLNVVMEDSDVGTVLKRVSKTRFDELYPYINADAQFDGYPMHYCIYGGQILIGPRPDRTSYVYRLSYSQRAGTITAATVNVPFTDLYRDVLVNLVLALLYEGLEDYDKATFHANKAEGDLLPVQRRERKNAGLTTFNMQRTDF